MKIMRILPSMDFGGIERGVYDFSKRAVKLGHKIVIISGYGRFIPSLIENGIKWYNLPMDKKNLYVFLKSYYGLKKIVKKEKPDIIHVQSRFPSWIVYYARRNFPNVAVVTSIHNFYPLRWYSQSVGKGDIVIVVSKALKKYAMKYLKIPERKIRLVYNGVAEDFLNIKKEKKDSSPVIGMISRFTKGKGHFIFLKTVKNLYENGTEIKSVIVGSGSKKYEMKLKNWIDENGLNKIVKIIKVDSKEALKFIDILVVPSIKSEGFGRTVVEAQMAETPVIATNIGAVPELIKDGETGFLVNPDNSSQIVEKVKFIMKSPEKVKNIVEKAKKYAIENFSVDKMVEETLKVYEELV